MKVAYVVLLVALIPTFIAFFRVRENIRAQDQARFDNIVAQAKTTVDRRLVRSVDQMYNIRAFFAGSQKVEPDEWKAYLGSMSVRHIDLGIRSLGYAEKVTSATKREFLEQQRAVRGTNFAIIPAGERPVYYPIVYVSHFERQLDAIYGLDSGVRPERLEVIQQAIEQNKPILTGKINLMGHEGMHTNSAIFVYLPIYKKALPIDNADERQAATQGVIWMTIIPQRMFTLLFENPEKPGVDIKMFDGAQQDPDKLIYDSADTNDVLTASVPETHPTIARSIAVPVLNREWTVSFSTTPEFYDHSPVYLQWLTLATGLTVSFLLFGITWIQTKARTRAEQDAVALQRSEAILAVEKEQLEVTLYSIGDGVITTDTNAKIISINKAAQLLTGWMQNEAEGKPLAEVFRIVHEQSREPADSPVAKVLQTRAIVELGNHILLIARDGTERAIADSAAPIHDKGGGVTGVVLVFRDVTEKQKAEAQMSRESKLESVGLLAGGIAHDFNNLLTCIVSNIALARMPENSKEQTLQLLADAETATMRATGLTHQLLTFAQGGAPIRKPAHLDRMVREACQFAVRGSNVQCEFSLAADAWPVEIDEGQFRQVLNNLVINTRQAMPDGGRTEVSLENAELAADDLPSLPAGKYVKISIKDHGEGIKPGHLHKIFEPYFTTKKNGSGLGLATAYSIIRKHAGLIKVESTAGIGSTFQIYLPATNKPVAPPLSDLPHHEFAAHGRLLIMDDEAAVLKVLGATLRKIGYKVETAMDGREVIERYIVAKKNGISFDAIIMDLTIPNGMGGRETIKHLLELDPKVKAIVSSGYSLDPVMAHHREHGFCGVIPKPYRAEDLARVLKEVIGN